jgi:hypothetical protein
MSLAKNPLLPTNAGRKGTNRRHIVARCALAVFLSLYGYNLLLASRHSNDVSTVPRQAQKILNQCAALRVPAGPPLDFYSRESSDREQPGTPATLIRNATIWTGARDGTEVVYGDLFLHRGIVKALGYIPPHLLLQANEIKTVDASGQWVTPGLGILPLPSCFLLSDAIYFTSGPSFSSWT